MKKILSVAHYTFVENIRNKVFYIIVLFGAVIVGASLLMAAISGQQNLRALLDFGLGTIEFFALLTAGFAAVTLVLEEMQAKTIYLVLTRPVSKSSYLLGRFIGLLLAVFSGMLLMAAIHVLILILNGWQFSPRYIAALALSGEKIMVISALALFFSLFSTSAVSSITFTIFFWILGHFSGEISFLANRSNDFATRALGKVIYYTVPNMQYFNLRDFWDVPNFVGSWIAVSFAYGILYSAVFLLFGFWLLKYKEF